MDWLVFLNVQYMVSLFVSLNSLTEMETMETIENLSLCYGRGYFIHKTKIQFYKTSLLLNAISFNYINLLLCNVCKNSISHSPTL